MRTPTATIPATTIPTATTPTTTTPLTIANPSVAVEAPDAAGPRSVADLDTLDAHGTFDAHDLLDVLGTLDAAARLVEQDGIGALATEVLVGIGAAASAAGASPLLVALLLDPAEPRPARERAFGRIAALLAQRAGTEPT